MVTQYRQRQRKLNRWQFLMRHPSVILGGIVLIGGITGFVVGRLSAPEQTVTLIETVSVPVYESTMLVDTADVFLYDVPLSDSLQRYIYEICADEDVPVALVLAMIEHESGFNHEAVSATDDYGLMQINSVNHNWLEEKYRTADMLNPYQNVFCGVSIIGSYIKKYEGNYAKALMAYALGEYGAAKAWENGVASVKSVDEILVLFRKYEEVSHGENN